MAVREDRENIVFLHRIVPGGADRSYGIAVARLAGVPPPVLKRAKSVLDRLEKAREKTGGLAAGLGDLPLFAAMQEEPEPQRDALRDRLLELDIDALAPRDALDALYALKAEAQRESEREGD